MEFKKSQSLRARQRIRLMPAAYSEPGVICFITVVVEARRQVFSDAQVASATVEVLHTHANATGVPVYGYCVMPEHVHLLIGPSAQCDIVTFVGQFKNLAQRAAWKHGFEGRLWQKSFWDHFLRNDESFEQAIQYVVQNPVRREIVVNWREYPFSGSLVYDL